jgi:Skp family chaperone for outer membrane proteins
MNRSLVLALSLASAMAAGAQMPAPPATAPAPAPAGPAKIAVIAFKAAVAQTNEGQRDFADLEKKFMPRENQLKALNDEIEALTKQLQTQGPTLNDAERASRAKTIDEKKKKLERDATDARNDFQQEVGDMYNTLASSRPASPSSSTSLTSRVPCSLPLRTPTSPRPSSTPTTSNPAFRCPPHRLLAPQPPREARHGLRLPSRLPGPQPRPLTKP